MPSPVPLALLKQASLRLDSNVPPLFRRKAIDFGKGSLGVLIGQRIAARDAPCIDKRADFFDFEPAKHGGGEPAR